MKKVNTTCINDVTVWHELIMKIFDGKAKFLFRMTFKIIFVLCKCTGKMFTVKHGM